MAARKIKQQRTHTLGMKWRCVRGGDESVQQQRAASVPGVLWAAAAPQPARALQLRMVVQGLDLLGGQVEPAPPLLTLHIHKASFSVNLHSPI